MSPLLQSPSDLSLSSPALCCHTLADWRRVVGWCGAGHVVRSQVLLFLLKLAASGEAGLPTTDIRKHVLRQHWRQYPQFMQRQHGKRRVWATPDLLKALDLRDAAHAASLARVLGAMREQGMTSLEIGLLVHASREHTLRRHLHTLPWTTDANNRPAAMKRLRDLHLLALETHRTPQNNTNYLMLQLTPAGKKLLLGQWGKAAAKPDGETRRSGDLETGRMAA